MRAFALFLLIVGAVPAAGQVPASPAASAAGPPGRTVIGRVIAASDALPLRRARIVTVVSGLAAAPVFTDEDGRFEAPEPTSAYELRVTKAGYAPLDRPGSELGQPVVLRMAKAAVLTGRLADAAGQPGVGMTIRIRRLEPKTDPGPSEFHVETDDRGQYRLGNLAAGRYALHSYQGIDLSSGIADHVPEMAAMMLQARLERMRSAPATSDTVTVDARPGEEVEIPLVQKEPAVALPYAQVGGAVTGVLLDESGEPAEDVTVQAWQTRFAGGRLVLSAAGRSRPVDDAGRYRLFHLPAGRYLVVATPAVKPAGAGGSGDAFLPVYFPGRLEIDSASEVQVDRARETVAIDMAVPRSHGARIHGIALGAAGSRLDGSVVLVPSQFNNGPARTVPRASLTGFSQPSLAATPGPDGGFEITHVPPGVYALQAAATIREGEPSTASFTLNNGARQSVHLDNMHIAGITEFAMQRLTVADADIGPLVVTTTPTTEISGRVTVDGPGRAIAPADFGFGIANVDPDEVPTARGLMPPDVELERDGTFRLTGLTGRARIVLTRAPAGWWLKSADIGGVNAARTPVDFSSAAGARDDVTIVLAPTGATLAGTVTASRNDQSFSVIVFPVDPALRISGSRYVRTTDPDADGGFSLNSLPPGDYLAIAVEAEDGDFTGDWESPDKLETLTPLARRVTLAERETQRLELRAVAVPR